MDKIRRGPYGKRKRELFDSSVTDVDLDDDRYIEIYSGAESAGHHSTHISSCVSDDISPVDLNVCDDISPNEQYETGQIGYMCVYEHNLDDGDNAEVSMTNIWANINEH